jgi:hypothetical protein
MSLDLFGKLKSIVSNTPPGAGFDYDADILLDNPSTVFNRNQSNLYDIFQPLPSDTTILGICEDGLPLVLDLNDPNPGAILILGKRDSGKTQLLKSILYSASSINNINQLYFYMLTPESGKHHDLISVANCYGLLSSYERAAFELIADLTALCEQRKSGRHLGTKIILAIDNLYELIKHQDFDVISNLKWLYRYGSRNGIWVITTIDSDRADLIEPDMITEQKTQILCDSNHRMLPDNISSLPGEQIPIGYRTMIGNEWIDFWLPS